MENEQDEVCIRGSHLKGKDFGFFTPELQLPSLFYPYEHCHRCFMHVTILN